MVVRSVVVTGARRVGKVSRALFAALALLLTATHCVEIDDRELEETDGNSDLPADCRRDENDSDCFACNKAECCDQLLNCFASPDCLFYIDCGGNCGEDDAACLAACGDDFPEGEALLFDFTACGLDACGC